MWYCCDNCETMFSDNDSAIAIIDRDDGTTGYYCCDDCANDAGEENA